MRTFFLAAAAAALAGVAAGWLRYWFGVCLVVQAGLAALVLGCGVGRLLPAFGLAWPQEFRTRLWFAAWLTLVFLASQTVGLGFAQPWFDPLGYFGRILMGRGVEEVSGLSGVGSVLKVFAGSLGGVMWLVLNLVDALLLWVLLLIPGRPGKIGRAHV